MTDAAEEFLARAPAERRDVLRAVHDTVSSAAPQLDQRIWRGKMWGGTDQTILGYGHFSYVNSSREQVDWFLLGLANQKAYISLYVNATRDGKYLGQVYADRLGKVKIGSASISFSKLEDIDLDVLAELVSTAAENS